MLPTSLLLMKCLNKTEAPVFLSVVCSLFPKAIFLTFIEVDLIVSSPVFTYLPRRIKTFLLKQKSAQNDPH